MKSWERLWLLSTNCIRIIGHPDSNPYLLIVAYPERCCLVVNAYLSRTLRISIVVTVIIESHICIPSKLVATSDLFSDYF